MGANGKPRLSDPATTPRIGFAGSIERDRPVFEVKGGQRPQDWSVTVTPLVGAGGLGAQLGGGRLKPRAIFEVRATYVGAGLPEFGAAPATRRIETYQTEDVELARAIATEAVELIRAGERDILLNVLAERRKGSR
jgi:hypothetical protein